MNSSKGYDVFGNAVIKILDKYKNWNALAIGNEPREKHNFIHKRFKILDWIKHDEILKYYKKSSISIVPSKWQEPFGSCIRVCGLWLFNYNIKKWRIARNF